MIADRKESEKLAMDHMELIVHRTSVRSYDGNPLDDSLRRELIRRMEACPPNPFGARVRLELVDGNAPDGQRLGTYGMVSRAKTFLLGVADGGPQDREALGYAMEWAVLQATGLGLGTCWLGGTFDRTGFAAAANLTGAEHLPVVSPVGHAAQRPTLRSRLVHAVSGAGRKPWSALFFDGTVGTALSQEDAGSYREALEAVRLAPSAMNGQPWRVVRREGKFDFYRRETSAADGRIDIGIAVCHFDLMARARGLAGSWRIDRDGLPADGLRYCISWVE